MWLYLGTPNRGCLCRHALRFGVRQSERLQPVVRVVEGFKTNNLAVVQGADMSRGRVQLLAGGPAASVEVTDGDDVVPDGVELFHVDPEPFDLLTGRSDDF